MENAPQCGDGEQQLAFLVAGKSYCVPARRVLEIGRKPVLTRVPNAPSSLAGLMNFHGAAIPVVRLAVLLKESEDEPASPDLNVIVYDDQTPVALLVDGVQRLNEAAASTARLLDIAGLLAARFVEATPGTRRAALKQALAGQPAANEPERPLVAFSVAGQSFALPLDNVAEVLRVPEDVTSMPRSEAIVIGMWELRDEVIPLISLAGLLGLQGRAGTRQHIIVTELDTARIGLVAEEIHGVVRIPEGAIGPVPAILQRGEGDAEIEAIARSSGPRPLISILSPQRLFGSRVIAGAISSRRMESPDMLDNEKADAQQRFIVFRIGDDVLGLPIGAVDEIAQLPDAITRVPNAPDFIAGVINLRGSALPVIDQRVRFDAAPAKGAKRPRLIVLTIEHLRAGFIVDSVTEIISVPTAAISQAPNLPGDGAQVFDRVVARDETGAMILLIDPKQLLNKAEQDLLDRFKTEPESALQP
jgi:purine-binding chemotaxis protein CheW